MREGCRSPPCSVTVHADKQRDDDPDVKDAFQTRADYCLMATGRKPNTHNLGLEDVRGQHAPSRPGSGLNRNQRHCYMEPTPTA